MNVRSARHEMRKQGMMRLKPKYRVRRRKCMMNVTSWKMTPGQQSYSFSLYSTGTAATRSFVVHSKYVQTTASFSRTNQ